MRSAITITSFLMISMTVPASQTPAQKQKIEVATIKPSIPSPVVRIGGSCHGTDSAYYLRHRATTIGTMCLCQHHSGRLVVQYLRSPVSNGIRTKVIGGPSWVDSERWEIQGRTENPSSTKEFDLHLMLRQLIIERFQLQFHSETKEGQGYALGIAKNGPKFSEDHRDVSPSMSFNGTDASFRNSSLNLGLRQISFGATRCARDG